MSIMSDRFAALGRIAAGVAHDLCHTLELVGLSLAEVRRYAEDPMLQDAARDAQGGADRALELSRCLLEYARGGRPTTESVDLVATVHHLLDLFGRVIPEKVRVVVDAEDGLPRIGGVPTELEQLVLNLVVNACDAMADGGELRVTLRTLRESVCLEIADSGPGIAETIAAAGALGPSTKPGRLGVGLGLGIVRSIADRHRATVQITAREGGGTVARVTFPAARRRSAA